MALDDPLAQDLRLTTTTRGFDAPAKRTCKGCPWRKDAVPGALGGWTPLMYMEAVHGPADIACHMSKDFDGHVETHMDPAAARPRSCAGLAAYRAKTGVGTQHPMSETQEAVTAMSERPDALAEVFDSPNEFILHHETPEGRAEVFWRADRAGCGTRKDR